MSITVQSLDDDNDLPELEAGGVAIKSDNGKTEGDSVGKTDTPTEVPTPTAESIPLPATTEPSSTNSVDDNKNSSDPVL